MKMKMKIVEQAGLGEKTVYCRSADDKTTNGQG